ncbi:hypothetical protein CCH79_00017287 [Gambusia affinis]|uniref:IF rod domain-containing protein n=1 Tax=Gambusia affinis TaxID=33528 RepID=A0A315WDG5_GAMAF|nr:hypothetical protein CCH79_00017287 [Gambusia affinis]
MTPIASVRALVPRFGAQASNMADNSELMSNFRDQLVKRNNDLQELNGRFASYIDKIHSLEQKNQKLEVEINQLQSHESKRVTEMYEEEINNLRKEMQNQNQKIFSMDLKLKDLNERLQKATDEKEEALKKLEYLKEDLDAPTQASKALEAEIKTLHDQLAFQKKIQEEKTEEIQEMKIKFQEKMNNVQTDAANSDLAAVLQELKAQFQKIADTKSSETEEWYESQISEMTETINTNNDTLRKLTQENTNLKNQSQKNLREISSLTAEIKELEERSQTLQETITALEDEKNKIKDDMVIQVHEYQDLLKVKETLDMEINMYKTLLEMEERRVNKNSRRVGAALQRQTVRTLSGFSASDSAESSGSSPVLRRLNRSYSKICNTCLEKLHLGL